MSRSSKSSLRSLLRSTPFQLLLCILFASLFGKMLPHALVRGAYTLSLFFIDCVLFLLPIMIFAYMFNALIVAEEKGPVLVFSLLGLICISNAVALCFAYSVGSVIIPHLSMHVGITEVASSVQPYFYMPFKHGIRSDYVALSAFVIAFFCVKAKGKIHATGAIIASIHKLQSAIATFLKKAFLPILPLYVLGFMLKMSSEDKLTFLYTEYLHIFGLNLVVSFCYILALYKIASIGYKPMRKIIFDMLPAGITGFSTMSSAITMPVTLECAEKNVQHPALARMVVPTASNMHMLGDDVTITLTALTLIMVSGAPLPSFIDFLPYVAAFCVAKLACVGIAGASLLVVLPVLQEHLGFSSEMVSLMTTLYALHDPFGTFHNVMGNGAFSLLVEKIFKKLRLVGARATKQKLK
ncbi:MAG: cation:dicarboxylase symporter family transporter [Proteobacteria bacterium]|nr:cation:dicarboxylase symporter family transporter [Pseudomonadota bacterium]